ncbi:MAG: DUF333 domain-containing protein, partial [Candidatus Aenigmarchaeota archaeon]|nr:DUF333 domain-containing protein [Candidatus Aenigmarchaeota archaeon]
MKKLSILFSLIFFLTIIQVSYAIPNPAAVYCKESGYNYKIVETEKGQKGFCVLPDKECDAWEFYSGECGIEYSSKYCAKRGYDRADKVNDGKNSFFPKYTVCVPKIQGQEKKSVIDLMELKKLLKTKEVATVTTTTVQTFKQTTVKTSIVKQTTTTMPTSRQTTTK